MVQRYDIEDTSRDPFRPYRDMVKADDGDWVRYEEIASLERQLADNNLAFEHANEVIGKLETQLAEAKGHTKVDSESTVHCDDCGAPYGKDGWCDVIVPDEIWNKIAPNGGLLCFRCMTKRIQASGLDQVPVAVVSGPYVDKNEDWRLIGWNHGYKVASEDWSNRVSATERQLAEARQENVSLVDEIKRLNEWLEGAKARARKAEQENAALKASIEKAMDPLTTLCGKTFWMQEGDFWEWDGGCSPLALAQDARDALQGGQS